MNTPNDTPSEVLVGRLFQRIGEVSSLPVVALQIIDVANDPMACSDDLLDAVRLDAALAARIMRTVNSSYYALRSKVEELKMAITLLGFKEIRNLAITAYVAQLFKESEGYGTYDRRGLWNHLIGAGSVARLIADYSGQVPPREAYLAGLLHDIGLILLDQYLHEPFCRVVDKLSPDEDSTAAETELLGFDHTELGGYVMLQWKLPEYLAATAIHHHRPELYTGEHRKIVCAVALANFFCNLKGVTSLGVANTTMPETEIFAELNLGKPQVAEIWNRLDEVFESANLMALMQGAEDGEGPQHPAADFQEMPAM